MATNDRIAKNAPPSAGEANKERRGIELGIPRWVDYPALVERNILPDISLAKKK